MAAISLSDCTVSKLGVNHGLKTCQIVTPATADDGDTIDVSSLFESHVWGIASSTTDGTVLCAGTSATSLTLPGSTDNEARTIFAFGF